MLLDAGICATHIVILSVANLPGRQVLLLIVDICPVVSLALCHTRVRDIARAPCIANERTSTFDRLSNRPAILKHFAWRCDTRMLPSRGCVTTHTIETCLLFGVIRGLIMLFYAKPAITVYYS